MERTPGLQTNQNTWEKCYGSDKFNKRGMNSPCCVYGTTKVFKAAFVYGVVVKKMTWGWGHDDFKPTLQSTLDIW